MSTVTTEARTSRSRSPSTRATVQAKLLDDAATDKSTGQLLVKTDLTGDLTPVPTAKRQLGVTPESDRLPAKRARLTRSRDAQQPGVEKAGHGHEHGHETTLRQPEPRPSKRLYASFLKDFVDPVHPQDQPQSLHTFISEWLETVGSDREKRCRSDSHLYCSDGDPVPRQLARSAPEMAYQRNAGGFALPPMPASAASRSSRVIVNSVSGTPSDRTSPLYASVQPTPKGLVEIPTYQTLNLASNNIYVRYPGEEFPEHITELIDHVRRDRDSPGPLPDELRQSVDLYMLENAAEDGVTDYFIQEVVPKLRASDSVQKCQRQPMAKQSVPSSGSQLKVSTPVPDVLYGYRRDMAFPRPHQYISLGDTFVANSQDLIFPFFDVEFNGDSGKMWVATNQCFGGAVACVNLVERLNHQLRQCGSDTVRLVDSAAFGIAMNGSEARLYISWKHNDLVYYVQRVQSFLIQMPEQYIEFRKFVRNILDWGKNRRLNEIIHSLDILLEGK